TVDCLSRERREGTLGLLFLTDLRSHDVVLGKTAAASLDMVLGLVAALPLLALPLLVGGTGATQYFRLALALGAILVLSLAIGVLASALSNSSRTALATTLGILLFLSFGVPFLGEGVFHIHFNDKFAALFYSVCPLYTLELCLDLPLREPSWKYWTHIGAMQLLAWCCLIIACARTAKSWRDQPASKLVLRWSERFRRWQLGGNRLRLRWRRLMLERNPIAWLEGRDHLQERILWAGVLLAAVYCLLKRLHSPRASPDDETLVFWPWWAHCALGIWLMIQAPRRLAEDKHSGALELLLCTGLSYREIVRGNFLALRRRYGRALIGLLTLDAFLLLAYFSSHGQLKGLLRHDVFQLFLWGPFIFPFQLYCIARVGIYQGLVQPSSVRASFAVFWRVGLLPWILFFVLLLTCDYYAARFKVLRVSETLACTGWGLCHLLPCSFFLARANWNLSRNFQALATTARPPSWRERLIRLATRRRPSSRPTIRIQVQPHS
ncbi:MAG TPA: ABC transporter permease subunit, partial [Verrucomicrobiae bacterium]|nr:ABC transporter permease subunit [Verrucomicrobiae bacterium]